MNLVDPIGDEQLRAMGCGLSGSHRTGKTTVAKVIAERHDCPFVASSASAIAKEMGIKVDAGMPLRDRLKFQERVLQRFEGLYAEQNGLFVSDRTPIDLAAYAMADWNGATTSPELDAWLNNYVAHCLTVTNRYFFHIAVIQPGIPYVDEDGKPAANTMYQEIVNFHVIGAAMSNGITSSVGVIPRCVLDNADRVNLVIENYKQHWVGYRDILKGRVAAH